MRRILPFIIANLLHAQALRIANIDFFGLRTIPEQHVRSVLGVHEGDAIVPSDTWGDAMKKRIEAIPGISEVSLDLGCCAGAGRATLTIGIVETGAPVMSFRVPPNSGSRLPREMVKTYHDCIDAWEHAIRIGDNQDDVEEGQ